MAQWVQRDRLVNAGLRALQEAEARRDRMVRLAEMAMMVRREFQ